jgi:hypothetical protein
VSHLRPAEMIREIRFPVLWLSRSQQVRVITLRSSLTWRRLAWQVRRHPGLAWKRLGFEFRRNDTFPRFMWSKKEHRASISKP